MKYIAIISLLFSSMLFAQIPEDDSKPQGPLQIIVVPSPPDLATQDKIDKMDKKAGDQKEYLQHLMWKWQKKLHLTNWNIAIAPVDLESFPYNAVGVSQYDPETYGGQIGILDAGQYLRLKSPKSPKTLKAIKKDQEDTVVHELLHLWMKYAQSSPEGEEGAVQMITRTILNEK